MKIKTLNNILLIILLSISVIITNGCSMLNKSNATDKLAENKALSNEEELDSYMNKKTYQKKLTQWFRPYKIDVQQGNVLSSDMLNKLKVGMTKQQTRHLLGTSVLTSNFNQDQWIYAFSDSQAGKLKKEHLLILSFNKDKITDIKEDTAIN